MRLSSAALPRRTPVVLGGAFPTRGLFLGPPHVSFLHASQEVISNYCMFTRLMLNSLSVAPQGEAMPLAVLAPTSSGVAESRPRQTQDGTRSEKLCPFNQPSAALPGP